MLTRDDLIDIVLERLSQASSPAPRSPSAGAREPGARGRLFLSEYDIKKRLTGGRQELRIPQGAILSPLALDWLALQRVRIVRE